MNETESTDTYTSGIEQTEGFSCPYPGCDWEPSRGIDSDVPLTQAVISNEIEQHRSVHADTDRSESDE